MLPLFDGLRELSLGSMALRLLLAAACGGAIGMEREFKRRPAGFRTHILICLGAAVTTLTSQYLTLYLGLYTDLARLGAQVVTGVGFIGAGTIIVTRRQQVKGLTTAAGLWASAVTGLALGCGFYEGGIFAAALILAAELLLSRLERRMLELAPEITLFVEYTGGDCLDTLLRLFRRWDMKILNMSILRSDRSEFYQARAVFTLRVQTGPTAETLLKEIQAVQGVGAVQQL